MTTAPKNLADEFIAEFNAATLALTNQVNIMAQLAEDAAALLAKIAVRDLMATPSRNQPPGPLRKGRGGKIRRW